MKTVLVTGGAGFIGSHFIRLLLKSRTDCAVINLDALTYAGSLETLWDVERNSSYIFIRGDIRERRDVEEIFSAYPVDWVVNFAAQTHVDRSIQDPRTFFDTNVLGAQTLLEAAMRSWNIPHSPDGKKYREGVRFLQISTDEVYGESPDGEGFSEDAPLLPRNPYAASKAGADLLVRAYRETYTLPVMITRCCNNYGPNQYPEKLIPLTVTQCLAAMPIPVYGDGKQIREWLHVSDHCAALMLTLQRGKPGEVYNIGGVEKRNIEVVKRIVQALGADEALISFVQDRPGHDRRYALNCAKIRDELGWKREVFFGEGLAQTVRWYAEHPAWVERAVCTAQPGGVSGWA